MELDFAFRPDEGLPASAYPRLRAAGSVVWSEALGGWLVSSYETARTVLSDVRRFTMEGTPVAAQLGAEAMLINDTPMHHAMRGVWAKQVSRAALEMRAAELEANAAGVLEPLRSRLDAGETVDLIPVIRQFVMEFIASSFAVAHDRLGVFQRWAQLSADTPALGLAPGSEAEKHHLAVKAEVIDLVRDEIAARHARFARGEQPDDLISLMAAAEGMSGITRPMVEDNVFNFILGAMDTTEKWLGNIIVRLCEDGDLRARIQADRSLIEPLIDEVMRFDTVAQVVMRRVKPGGAELDGQELGEGDQLFVMLGAANRDPAEFEDPDHFDIRRAAKPNLGFGFGFHHCLGINIARQEALAFITTILDLLPDLRVAACDYGQSWALWGPRRLELSLTAGDSAA
jgi:cytochrome P450